MTHTCWPGGWSVLLKANTRVTVEQTVSLTAEGFVKIVLLNDISSGSFVIEQERIQDSTLRGGGGGDGANPSTETLYVAIFSGKKTPTKSWNVWTLVCALLPIRQCTEH